MLVDKILVFLEEQPGRVYSGDIEEWCSALNLDNSGIDDVYRAVREIKLSRSATVLQHGNGYLSVRLTD